MKAHVNLGVGLNDVIGKDVKYNGKVVGIITSYDGETGMATIDITSEYDAILTQSQDNGISSRGFKK